MALSISSLYPYLGHNFHIVLKFLKPRYLSLYATSNKENLKMVQKYLKYVKNQWEKRILPINLHITYHDKKIIPIDDEVIKKCMIIAPRVRLTNGSIVGEILSAYTPHRNSWASYCIYIYVLGGKGAKKMQNGDIEKSVRGRAPLIFRQYPLLLSSYDTSTRLIRFIPYQI